MNHVVFGRLASVVPLPDGEDYRVTLLVGGGTDHSARPQKPEEFDCPPYLAQALLGDEHIGGTRPSAIGKQVDVQVSLHRIRRVRVLTEVL